ncbi:MAG: serine/threonine protein phosphatase [Chloroflexi bacterium]|nr:serine/threonine protein phosphatase [Chloroflexota bacterium]MBP8056433.1 serine/threonine protein phosphatase [Chloroflexota bacterium]
MKTLVVGDIHGCYDEFRSLLDKAGLSAEDQIIALGDIVDRGPDPVSVVEFFRYTANTVALAGNHERKHVRSYQGTLRPALSQVITRWQYQQAGADYGAAAAFMASLPFYQELPEAILVHAYLEPGIPLKQQRLEVLVGHISGDHYLAHTYDRPWYELVDRDKPVIVGHRNYLNTSEPFVYQDRVFGLDTGVYHGLALTGLILPDFHFVSVRARGNHWQDLKVAYQQAQTL